MPATVFDRYPLPPCAKLLGWTLLEHDAAQGWAKSSFVGRAEFLNPAGFIQGGFVSAMLDDTMGPAVFLMTQGRSYTVTVNMNVSFLAPARVGPLFGEGRVVQLGKTIAFVEGKLCDAENRLIATASASLRLVAVEKLAA